MDIEILMNKKYFKLLNIYKNKDINYYNYKRFKLLKKILVKILMSLILLIKSILNFNKDKFIKKHLNCIVKF